MAALMRITVEHVGGDRATYTVLPVTVVAFERHFAVGLGAIATENRMEYVYWLAWDSERRSGKTLPPFDTWLETVAEVEAEDEAAPLDPASSPVS